MATSAAAETIVAELPWWATPSNLLLVVDWLEDAWLGIDVPAVKHLLEKAYNYDAEYACAVAVLAHRVETTTTRPSPITP